MSAPKALVVSSLSKGNASSWPVSVLAAIQNVNILPIRVEDAHNGPPNSTYENNRSEAQSSPSSTPTASGAHVSPLASPSTYSMYGLTVVEDDETSRQSEYLARNFEMEVARHYPTKEEAQTAQTYNFFPGANQWMPRQY